MEANSTTPAEQQVSEEQSTANAAEPFRAPDAVGAPADAPAKPDVEQLVDQWFVRHFHGIGHRLDEFLYNQLHHAKEELKKLLRAQI